MPTSLQETVLAAHDRFSTCADEAERWDAACALLVGLGVDWVTAGTAPRDRPEALAIFSTTPGGLMRDYIGARLHEIDPWMKHCAQSTLPDAVDIGATPTSGGLLDPSHRLVRLLSDHGVVYVSLSPAWRGDRPGGIVTYCRTADGAAARRSPEGQAALRLMVATIAVWCRPEQIGPDRRHYRTGPTLSPREVETLHWLAAGLRTTEIAWRMGVADITVSKHLASARRKLGARTREQALAEALRGGFLRP